MVLRRSIRMVVPRLFLTGPRWRRPDIILERTPGRGWSPSPDPAFRGSTGGPGLLLSRRKIDARIDLAAALPGEPRACQFMHSTPQTCCATRYPSRFGPVFGAPESQNSGQKNPSPAASTGGGVVILEPFGSDRRGPKHTRAEQEES